MEMGMTDKQFAAYVRKVLAEVRQAKELAEETENQNLIKQLDKIVKGLEEDTRI